MIFLLEFPEKFHIKLRIFSPLDLKFWADNYVKLDKTAFLAFTREKKIDGFNYTDS